MKQHYNHPSHHRNLHNPFLDHSASDDKIVWAYPVPAAVPTQVQPWVRQASVCPGPFNLPVTSATAAYTPALTHAPCRTRCSCPKHSFCPAGGRWSSVSCLGTASNHCLCTCSRKGGCKKPHFLFAIYFSSFILHILFWKDLQQQLLLKLSPLTSSHDHSTMASVRHITNL